MNVLCLCYYIFTTFRLGSLSIPRLDERETRLTALCPEQPG